MSMRDTILDEIRAVASEQGKTLPPLNDDLPLLESGLDSLCFAILVSRLEDFTGVDPFSAPYLQGSTIDFLEGLQESGFKIENPNVTAACGCGHSFQVEEGEAPDPAATACGSG